MFEQVTPSTSRADEELGLESTLNRSAGDRTDFLFPLLLGLGPRGQRGTLQELHPLGKLNWYHAMFENVY